MENGDDEDVSPVAERLNENLQRYREFQQPLNSVLDQLGNAYSRLKSIGEEASGKGSGAPANTGAHQKVTKLLEKIVEDQRAEFEAKLKSKPFAAAQEAGSVADAKIQVPSDVEDILLVENTCFKQLRLLHREEANIMEALKRDFEDLLGQNVPPDQTRHWEFVGTIAEALDTVEKDYKLKKCIIDKFDVKQVQQEPLFVYNLLLSLRPLLHLEALDRATTAFQNLCSN